MSANTPFGPDAGREYLGAGAPADAPEPADGRRRWSVIGAATACVVGVVALGGWGAYALLAGGGDQPSSVVPADAVGYVSLDLDPSAAQKVELFQILNKFPALEKELDVSSKDDLRELVFTGMQEEGTCEDLDYAKDVEPWIGDRVALAGAPVGGKTVPLMALQVTDEEAAGTGMETLAKCGEAGDDFGHTFLDGYVIISDSDEHAAELADAAEKASLSDDPGFQKWMDEVGDPGFISAYASADAPKLFAEMSSGFPGGEEEFGWMGNEKDQAPGQAAKQFADFEGGAAVIRFEDGAVEAEFAGMGMPAGITALSEGTPMTDLPASTGIALAAGLSEGWLTDLLASIPEKEGMSVEDMLREAEAASGLELPQDAETLLGDGFALAVDADVDLAQLMQATDPTQIPVGLRVDGDPDEILPIVERIKAKVGPPAGMLIVESGDGVVAFGTNPAYTRTLLDDGSLGDDESFTNVVPEADAANGVFYVNFDAGDGWAESLASALADSFGGAKSDAKANVAPLDALGASGWVDSDEVQRGLFRLTTD